MNRKVSVMLASLEFGVHLHSFLYTIAENRGWLQSYRDSSDSGRKTQLLTVQVAKEKKQNIIIFKVKEKID